LDVFPPEIKWNVYFQISKPLKATIFIWIICASKPCWFCARRAWILGLLASSAVSESIKVSHNFVKLTTTLLLKQLWLNLI
jgi:hypothetical protein